MRRARRRAAPRRGRSAVLLIAHGSRAPRANRTLRQVARALRRRIPAPTAIVCCFLEAATPRIPEGVDRCVGLGARNIVFVPYFLTPGGHVARDLPAERRAAGRRHPGVRIAIVPPLGFDPRIVGVVAERARLGLARLGAGGRRPRAVL